MQVAHFSDAYAADTSPSAYTATINWGDGGATASYTIVADANGGFDVFASKASPYAEQGNYGIAVTVTKTDADAHNLTGVTPVTASTVTADTTATVADAGLSVTKRDISATTGMSFSSVQVATLTDAAGSYSNPADLSVTINWGDETAPDSNVNLVEVGSTGVYKVEGSHMYAAAGQYPVTVSVSDRGGSKADDSAAPATATVTNAVWVDDNWTDVTNPAASTPAFGDVVAAPTGEIAPGATTLIYGVDAFNTIQGGVNADASGGTVYVLPGTYAENVVVPKSLSILGPNATIDPNNPLTPRNTEAIVVPAVADIETGDGGTGDTNGTIFRLGDPNNPTNPITVTIEGLTIDGNNAALPTSEGRLLNGVYVDTGAGIINSTGSYDQNPGGTKTTMIIENNIIENLDRYGVLGDTVGGTPQSGAIVSDNLITNIPSGNNYGGDRGRGVAFETNYYGTVSNNTITDVNVGYQNDNFYLPDPSGLGLQITNNTISTYHRGIFYNLVYDAASTGTISGNNISVDNTGLGADANNFGLEIISVESGVAVNVSNNSDTGSAYGVLITGDSTTAGITVTGGTLTGNKYGVYVTDNDPQFPSDGNTPNAVLNGITIKNPTSAGIFVESANGETVVATIEGGTSITGGPTGILVSGANASLAFSGANPATLSQTGNYITLADGAMAGQTIDATNVTFDSYSPASLSDMYAVEGKITDYLDNSTLGYVSLNSTNVYVAYSSEQSSAGAVQRGINAAPTNVVGTVNVQAGTYVANADYDNKDAGVVDELNITRPLTLSARRRVWTRTGLRRRRLTRRSFNRAIPIRIRTILQPSPSSASAAAT